MARQFIVSYYYKKSGDSGKGSRAKVQGTVGQALGGAQSETAVLDYLRQRHHGNEITIMSLDWK